MRSLQFCFEAAFEKEQYLPLDLDRSKTLVPRTSTPRKQQRQLGERSHLLPDFESLVESVYSMKGDPVSRTIGNLLLTPSVVRNETTVHSNVSRVDSGGRLQ